MIIFSSKTVTNAVKKSLSEHLVESDRDNSDEKQDTIMAKVLCFKQPPDLAVC